ncbi:serine hydrolase [Candidatus Methylacidiphilum infernorum]|uniref:Serine hydrolase n=1 Tax=Candidatus Methylacidiphilum infernorum TaxID=511746 RepID=A0ABX7PWL6_9BACT|nr:serine hydrolase [Candidatus Methylacidiphilum infernorum]QSR87118.1 serine hydrolase [Candidatus Methylacidiphilum infernorum]
MKVCPRVFWFLFLILLFFSISPSVFPRTSSFFPALQIQKAAAYSRVHNHLSLLIIKDGQVLHEEYSAGNGPLLRHRIFSGTKGFWGVIAMKAQEEKILSLHEPVYLTIQEWKEAADFRKKITVYDLLHFTDGIEPAFYLHNDGFLDRNSHALLLKPVRAPGSIFTYGPSHLQIFCELLNRKLRQRGMTACEYMEKNLLEPLEIHNVEFKRDGHGNPLLAAGFRLTAREWARLGELILNKGWFKGKKIISWEYLKECFQGSPINPLYGIGFWVNSLAPYGREIDVEMELSKPWEKANWKNGSLCNDAPSDLVESIGSANQRMFVIPSMHLIIVRQSHGGGFSDRTFLKLLLGTNG